MDQKSEQQEMNPAAVVTPEARLKASWSERPLILEILMMVFMVLGGANTWGALLELEEDSEYFSVMVSCAVASAGFAFYCWARRRKYRAIRAEDSGVPIRGGSEIFIAVSNHPWMGRQKIMAALVWMLIAGGTFEIGLLSVMMAELAERGGVLSNGWKLKIVSYIALHLLGVILPIGGAHYLDLRLQQSFGGEGKQSSIRVHVERWIFRMLAAVSLVAGSIVSVFAFYGVSGWVGGLAITPIEGARTQLLFYGVLSGIVSLIFLVSACWFNLKARNAGHFTEVRSDEKRARLISGFHIWTACALIMASMIYSIPRLLASRDARPLHGHFDIGLRCMGGHEIFVYLDDDFFYQHCPGHRDTRRMGRALRSGGSATEISKIGKDQRIRLGWRVDYDARRDQHILWFWGKPRVVYQVNNPWRTWFPKFMPE